MITLNEKQNKKLNGYFTCKIIKSIYKIQNPRRFFSVVSENTQLYLSNYEINTGKLAIEKLKNIELSIETIFFQQKRDK